MVCYTKWLTPPERITFADYSEWGAYVPEDTRECVDCSRFGDRDYCWSCSRNFPDMYISKVVE